jgi:hypothetical protein
VRDREQGVLCVVWEEGGKKGNGRLGVDMWGGMHRHG